FFEKDIKPVKKIVYKIRIEDKLKKIKNLQPENPDQWLELYRKFYEAERLAEKENKMMDFQEKFNELEDEKNNQFAEYYLKNYPGWLKGTLNDAPMLSHQVFKSVKSKERSTYYLIIDGMRYDQWLYIKDDLSAQILKNYKLADFKDYYFSVIPTVTEIARKSLIGGKKFSDISKGNSDDYLLKSLFSAKTMMSSYNSDKSWRTFEIENLIEDKPDVLVIRIQNMDNVIHKLQETKNPINNGKLLDYFQAEMKHDIFHLISSLIELNSRIVITADHGCIVSRGEQKIDKNGIILRERYFIKSPEKIIKPENYFTISSGEIGMPEISHEYCFMKNPYISPKKNQISPNSVTHGGVSLNECVVPLAVFDPA
ncbi:MAG: PglZ domain-containing protein, partial [Calditrichaceae bacterium]